MARKDRKDRGLFSRPIPGTKGKLKWFVRLWHEGKERCFGSFKKKTEAREFYEKAKKEQREQQFFPEQYQRSGYAKLVDLIDGYMATNTNKGKGNDRRYAAHWKAWFRDSSVNAITPAAIDQAKHELLSKGLAPQTALHYLKFLRHMLNLAVRDEKLHRNPMLQVSLPKVAKGCTRFLSLEEEQALCEQIDSTYAPWIRFAVLTGLRRGEQFRLKWGDIDQVRGLITLRTTKAGHGQYVHMSQEAQAVIEALKAGNTSVWVFPSQNPDTPIDTYSFYQRIYLPAVKATGLDAVTWHTLRHTFASRLAMKGASDGDIAASLRHSGTALVKRYAHLSPSHLKGVMEKASAFGKPAEKDGQVGSISNGTVTRTGTATPEPEEKDVEVLD